MASPYLKVYRIKHANVWPYESVQSAMLIEKNAPLVLTADIRVEDTYRCYRRHADQYVEVAAMEDYDETWEGAGSREISPYQLIPNRSIALQIEYVVYRSWRDTDYPKLAGLTQRIKKGGVEALGFPADIRPSRAVVQGDNESHPWESLRLDGTHPPKRPTSAFIALERSDLPYINHHTSPEGIDYQFVNASVVTYDFYERPPAYKDLMHRLDKYCAWFEKLQSDTQKRRSTKSRTKRQR